MNSLVISAHPSASMDLGSNFRAKLEPYLLIAKSVKGAAAAKLVQDATAATGVFVFSELLELPNIQEVCILYCQQLGDSPLFVAWEERTIWQIFIFVTALLL